MEANFGLYRRGELVDLLLGEKDRVLLGKGDQHLSTRFNHRGRFADQSDQLAPDERRQNKQDREEATEKQQRRQSDAEFGRHPSMPQHIRHTLHQIGENHSDQYRGENLSEHQHHHQGHHQQHEQDHRLFLAQIALVPPC